MDKQAYFSQLAADMQAAGLCDDVHTAELVDTIARLNSSLLAWAETVGEWARTFRRQFPHLFIDLTPAEVAKLKKRMRYERRYARTGEMINAKH